MTLWISDYTCKIVKQTLVTDKRAIETPYLYEVPQDIDLTKLEYGELEVIERNAWDIADRIMKERERREVEKL